MPSGGGGGYGGTTNTLCMSDARVFVMPLFSSSIVDSSSGLRGGSGNDLRERRTDMKIGRASARFEDNAWWTARAVATDRTLPLGGPALGSIVPVAASITWEERREGKSVDQV